MLWSFCSKGGGVFFWQGYWFFLSMAGDFFAGVLEFFFQWQWIFGVRVYVFFESIGEYYRIRV